MDCSICATRSAVENCAECRALLCEVCAVKCEHCGKVICPEHIHLTRGGRALCAVCMEERNAARLARHGSRGAETSGATDLESLEGGPEEEEEAIEDEALVVSVRKPPPPWKLSLYVACTGAVLVLIVLVVPSLRRFPLPWGGFFPTPYLLLIVPAVAAFWAVIGLVREDYEEERRRCFIGLGIALVTCVLAFVAIYTDPARLAEIESVRSQTTRGSLTGDELREWRKQKLDKFKP